MTILDENALTEMIHRSLNSRKHFLSGGHTNAFRLFNGFYEGIQDLVIDVYGQTVVLFNHGDDMDLSRILMQSVRDVLLLELPWVKCVIAKFKNSEDPELRQGEMTFGSQPEKSIIENGIRYALDLRLNQDSGFYIDTRNLRAWLKDQSAGKEVLNTFAYTGSLGVAALAGGAESVVQVDRNKKFLDLARQSSILNKYDLGKMKITAVDFFVAVGQMKQQKRLFDIVILDPPFFSTTEKGTVDQNNETVRLINKVRPLVRDGGRLIAINNALFLSGAEYKKSLDSLCKTGFVEIDSIIPVPEDVTGSPGEILTPPPVDPFPFNHPTKIAVLRIKRNS